MSLFSPSKEDVREFFCHAWLKQQASGVLTPLESIAARWIVEHPEYHVILNQIEAAKEADFSVENGQTNPFLHLSMHMSLSEQVQINQPVGIRSISQQLTLRFDSEHSAQHAMMECLAQVLWQAQQQGTAPDMDLYLESLNRLI
jgi:hypothetical protein